METLVRGDVVVLLFPFSDLSSSRKRPAVVVANLSGDDLILAQITSAASRSDEYAVSLETKDLLTTLPRPTLCHKQNKFIKSLKNERNKS